MLQTVFGDRKQVVLFSVLFSPPLLASNATLTFFTRREGHICVSSQLGSVPYFIHLRSLPACRLQSRSLPSAHSICFSAVLCRKERLRAVHGGIRGRCSSLRRETRAKQSRKLSFGRHLFFFFLSPPTSPPKKYSLGPDTRNTKKRKITQRRTLCRTDSFEVASQRRKMREEWGALRVGVTGFKEKKSDKTVPDCLHVCRAKPPPFVSPPTPISKTGQN